MNSSPTLQRYVTLVLPVIPALMLLPAVHFSLTRHPEWVALFSALDMEPTGRVLIGVIESLCIILLLLPGVAIYGALLTLAVMVGAMIALLHLSFFGLGNPTFGLFFRSFVAAICSMAVIYLRREQLPAVRTMFER